MNQLHSFIQPLAKTFKKPNIYLMFLTKDIQKPFLCWKDFETFEKSSREMLWATIYSFARVWIIIIVLAIFPNDMYIFGVWVDQSLEQYESQLNEMSREELIDFIKKKGNNMKQGLYRVCKYQTDDWHKTNALKN